MKHILLVVPRMNIGGAESYVATLALALQQKGFRVSVASGGGMLAEQLKQAGISQHFLPLRLSTGLSAWMLAKIIRKEQVDLVHANSAAAGIAAVKTKQRYLPDLPVIYTAHGVFGHNEKERLLDHCDQILCVSDFVRRDAAAKGYCREKLRTLYNGIDTERFVPGCQERASLREKMGIPEDAFVLAIVSRIKNLHDKGHGDLLEILSSDVRAKNWHLLVIGKGKALSSVQAVAKAKQMTDRVHCLGHVLDVENYLDAADLMVLPSKFETFGLVLGEAMAMGKPAIAYRAGGTAEVIADGISGYLAAPQNRQELADKICLLAENPKLCQKMGIAAREWVTEKFPYDKMMKELLLVYKQLLP